MADINTISQECYNLLVAAIGGNKNAEMDYVEAIRNQFMGKRIGRYMNRNRLVDNEDIKQEFMIGVALAIRNVRMDIGDPVEYTIEQGVYRVRSYVRSHIVKNTIQTCGECGHISRINRTGGGSYTCKKCGSTNIMTDEINQHNELIMEFMEDKQCIEIEVESDAIIRDFEETLTPGTNVYNLYMLLRNGTNRDNPMVKNYLAEIAKQWGCSNQNVLLVMRKLQERVIRWAADRNMKIENNQFVILEDIL